MTLVSTNFVFSKYDMIPTDIHRISADKASIKLIRCKHLLIQILLAERSIWTPAAKTLKRLRTIKEALPIPALPLEDVINIYLKPRKTMPTIATKTKVTQMRGSRYDV